MQLSESIPQYYSISGEYFLDPVVWQDAPTDANTIFGRMIITVIVVSVVVFTVFMLTAKRRVPGGGTSGWEASPFPRREWLASGAGHLAWDIIMHMVLPVATLTLISFAGTMLLTRNSMLETMREDYVLAARAKGLPDKQVRDRHVARKALLPVVTSFVFSLAFAIDGGVIIETVFSWPGMGQTPGGGGGGRRPAPGRWSLRLRWNIRPGGAPGRRPSLCVPRPQDTVLMAESGFTGCWDFQD